MSMTLNIKPAVLLLSSGLDSAANLALREPSYEVGAALTIDYGQRSAARECERAAALAKAFGIAHIIFPLRGFAELTSLKSALFATTGIGPALPVPRSLDEMEEIAKTAAAVWVPNRNGVLISLAAAFAESRGFGAVVVGFNAEEATTFPDNSLDYMEAMSRSLEFSTANRVKVVSATHRLDKKQIVERLSAYPNFPFEMLWSCYDLGDRHCGLCESCQRLKRALMAGLPEPRRSEVLEKLFYKARQDESRRDQPRHRRQDQQQD